MPTPGLIPVEIRRARAPRRRRRVVGIEVHPGEEESGGRLVYLIEALRCNEPRSVSRWNGGIDPSIQRACSANLIRRRRLTDVENAFVLARERERRFVPVREPKKCTAPASPSGKPLALSRRRSASATGAARTAGLDQLALAVSSRRICVVHLMPAALHAAPPRVAPDQRGTGRRHRCISRRRPGWGPGGR